MDFAVCKECGFEASSYRSLSQHLRQAHPDMSLQEYYDKHYKKPDEGICTVCGKPTMFSGRLNRGYYEHCSAKCTALDKATVFKRKETNRKIHGDEDEWTYNQDIVKSRLAGMLGFNSKIRASKCVVKTLSSKDADQFFEENHIQGSCVSSWRYGLYFGETLVAAMTFGKNRFGDGIELLRFCTAKNTNVLGGASRLFKHFIDDHTEIDSIVSFADRRWSGTSPFYPKLGFVDDGVSKPSYYYVINNRRHNRMEFTKGKLVKAGFDESLSEHDIMLKRKIYRIYDCGNRRFVWHRK